MKRKNSAFGIWFTLIGNACIVLCLVIGFFIMFRFSPPDIISETDFINYLEKKGCSIINAHEIDNSPKIDVYLITDGDTCPYQISYTVFNDNEDRDEFFKTLKDDVLNNNINVTGSTKISLSSYYEYSTSGNYYKAVTLNKNSVLYTSVDRKYRNEMLMIFKYFGYVAEPNWKGYSISWFSLVIELIILTVSMWGIEKKIRNKGWISLIPFYNIWTLTKDIMGSPFYCLLLLLPFCNVIFIILLLYNMSKAFEDDSYGSLLIFFPTIFLPLLAFDNSVYLEPEKRKNIKTVPNMMPQPMYSNMMYQQNVGMYNTNAFGNNVGMNDSSNVGFNYMGPNNMNYNNVPVNMINANDAYSVKSDKKKDKNIFETKLFWGILLIPYVLWFLFSLFLLIPMEDETDPLTLSDILIFDIVVYVAWMVLAIIISIVVRKIYLLIMKKKKYD